MNYYAWHKRLRRARGSASKFVCVECGVQAREWALKVEFEDREVRQHFVEDFEAYEPMCVKCHRQRDLTGRRHSDETKQMIGSSQKNHKPRVGWKHSAETRAKMSKARRQWHADRKASV